jgi:hypothetical protein
MPAATGVSSENDDDEGGYSTAAMTAVVVAGSVLVISIGTAAYVMKNKATEKEPTTEDALHRGLELSKKPSPVPSIDGTMI